MSKWIDIKKKLPKDGQDVLFILTETGINGDINYIFYGMFDECRGTGFAPEEGPGFYSAFIINNIPIWINDKRLSYWMAIPIPPVKGVICY